MKTISIIIHFIISFYLAAGQCRDGLSACITCLTGTKCALCVPGFFINNQGVCKQCKNGCRTCLSDEFGSCTLCWSGFTLHEGAFIQCTNANCSHCHPDNRTLCTACYDGNTLLNGNCQPCAIINCKQCNNNGCPPCGVYIQHYTAGATQCLKCSDLYCDTCYTDPNICNACSIGTGIVVKNASWYACSLCQIPNCKDCVYSTDCGLCRNGYGKNSTGCQLCKVVGCSSCAYNSGTCAYCLPNLGLNGSLSCIPCSVSNCIECSTNFNLCEKCGTGLGLKNNQCVPCDSAGLCVDCSYNASFCSACGYLGKNIYQYSGQCPPCRHSNCIDCSTNYFICTKCDLQTPHLGLIGYSNGQVGCDQCWKHVDNCVSCSVNVTNCTKCTNSTGPLNNLCVPCTKTNCVNCSNDPSICQLCSVGYSLPDCTPCTDLNCLSCPDIDSICIACDWLFGVDNGMCVSCEIEFCGDCKNDYLNCSACINGLGLIESPLSCQPCSDLNCKNCSQNFEICVQCNTNYGVNISALNTTNRCILCSPNCQTCYGTDHKHCSSCNPGLYMYYTFCIDCISQCLVCSSWVPCSKCNVSYYLTAQSTCNTCGDICRQCYSVTPGFDIWCTKCIDGYFLDIDANPNVCKQICGDSIIFVLPCDNQIGNDYDGCDDNCAVMDNFTCRNDSNMSICSYNQTIDLEIASVSEGKQPNQIIIVLKVHPPLPVFHLSSSLQLLQVFSISNKNLNLNQVKYDPLQRSFHFQIKILSQIQQNVQINFTPSESIHVQYFQTPSSTHSFPLINAPFYSTQQLLLIDIALYVAYVIMILSWIAFLLGMIVKHLAGLQAMFIVQFCWIIFVWIDCPFLFIFQSLVALKYSNGYNIKILEDASLSPQHPFTSEFGLSYGSFANNFNISLIMFLPLIIALFVTKIRLNISESSGMIIKQANNKKGLSPVQIDKKIDILVEQRRKHHQLSYQVFLNFVCLSLIYFVNSTVLFVKSNNFMDTTSLIMLIFSFVIMIMTFVKFYFDPDPFGYFRYSFKLKVISINHFYIQIVLLILSMLLLSCFPKFPYITFIPFALMIVLISVTQPYLNKKDNVRSIFNYFVICSFLGFSTYAQKIPKLQLKSFQTFLFLIAMLMLLLCVVLVGLIFQIMFILEQRKQGEGHVLLSEEGQRLNLMLEDLVRIDVRTKMKKIDHSIFFKEIVSPKTSLLAFNERIKGISKECIKQKNIFLQTGSKAKTQGNGKCEVETNLLREYGEENKKLSLKQKDENKQMMLDILGSETIYIKYSGAKSFKQQVNESPNSYIKEYDEI